MKIMTCPVNGPRPLLEFQYGGELRTMPDPATASDAEWADYVFNRSGAPAIKQEWWYHVPSGTWFVAERDTAADRIVRTWLPVPDGKRSVTGGLLQVVPPESHA
jgi:sarcosine oxidase subunit delta